MNRGDAAAGWLLGGLTLALSAAFVSVSYFVFNDGNLIAPLDDAYIHLQYARQIGEGNFFRYQQGDPISTGASSLCYPLILGAAYAAGFTGPLLLAFAVGLGSLCMALTTVAIHRLGTRLAHPVVGNWAALLVAVNGALLWGATSGMEVGLVALLVTASLLAFVRETPQVRYVLTPLVGTLAALSRPESLILASMLCAAMLWNIAVAVRAGRIGAAAGLRRAALSGAPVAAGIGQLLFYLAATGTMSANGMVAKSYFFAPLFYPTEVADATLGNVHSLMATLSGISTQDFVFPGAVLFFVLGLAHLAIDRPQWRSMVLALGLAFGLILLAVSTLMTAQWHNLRYLQPFLPLFLLLAVIGVHGISRAITDTGTRRLAMHGLLGAALLFALSVLPTWLLRLGQEAATIREAPVSIAQWLHGNLPRGSVVAVNDVGAVAYFSGHRTVDLVGLTTNGLAAVTPHGPGSLYEALRELPPAQRPDYFSIYDDWRGPPVHELVRAGLLGSTPLMSFDLKAPPHPGGRADPPCQSARTCNRVSVYEADWSLAGTGDRLTAPPPGRLRDYLNVGSLRSEHAHAYRVQPAQVGIQPYSTVRTENEPGRGATVDSGRRIVGGEAFTVHGLVPGRPLTVTARAGGPPGSEHGTDQLQVLAGGRRAGIWSLVPDTEDWAESSFTIPAELITGPTLRLELQPVRPLLSPYPDHLSYGYWFVQ